MIPSLEFTLWNMDGDEMESIERRANALNEATKVRLMRGGGLLECFAARLKIMDLGLVGNLRRPTIELMLLVKMIEYVTLGNPLVGPNLKWFQH